MMASGRWPVKKVQGSRFNDQMKHTADPANWPEDLRIQEFPTTKNTKSTKGSRDDYDKCSMFKVRIEDFQRSRLENICGRPL